MRFPSIHQSSTKNMLLLPKIVHSFQMESGSTSWITRIRDQSLNFFFHDLVSYAISSELSLTFYFLNFLFDSLRNQLPIEMGWVNNASHFHVRGSIGARMGIAGSLTWWHGMWSKVEPMQEWRVLERWYKWNRSSKGFIIRPRRKLHRF